MDSLAGIQTGISYMEKSLTWLWVVLNIFVGASKLRTVTESKMQMGLYTQIDVPFAPRSVKALQVKGKTVKVADKQ